MKHLTARLSLAAALSFLLASCAVPVPPMDRAKYLAVTNRTYEGVDRERLIAAALQVLSLADEEGFSIIHNDEGFSASHVDLGLGYRGTDTWEFKVKDTPGGARGSIQISSGGTVSGLAPTTSLGTYSLASSTVPNAAVPGDAIYDLFWARVDYLLFVRNAWVNCEDQYQRGVAGTVVGPTDPLCRRGTPDDTPGKPRAGKQVRRPSGHYEPPAQTSAAPPIAPDRKR